MSDPQHRTAPDDRVGVAPGRLDNLKPEVRQVADLRGLVVPDPELHVAQTARARTTCSCNPHGSCACHDVCGCNEVCSCEDYCACDSEGGGGGGGYWHWYCTCDLVWYTFYY